jgi:protocatechuate 3,4-dioxygenase beta subunit
MFGLMGAATVFAFWGSGDEQPKSSNEKSLQSSAVAAVRPSCVMRPEQTEGPYFVDAKLNRSDIRSEPSDHSIKQGVPLRLIFQVSRIDGAACTVLVGTMVDVWHCDALGVYSDARDPGFDTRGKKFLRGYQMTNPNGVAEFLTIYPGWYEGRAVHIHFKIRTDSSSRRAVEFTSQLYFDESVTDQIHKRPPYNRKGARALANDKDSLFRRGGKQLMPVLTKDAEGYAAKFEIGLRMT